MKYNTYQKILKKARNIIENEDHYFICWAIIDSSWAKNEQEGQEILDYIESALGEYDTLGQWLSSVANIPYELRTEENLKAYRLRYIDHLMEEFK
jgi:predicted phosphohydrolase